MFRQFCHHQGVTYCLAKITLITEQQVNEYNPVFELVNRKQLTAQSLTS